MGSRAYGPYNPQIRFLFSCYISFFLLNSCVFNIPGAATILIGTIAGHPGFFHLFVPFGDFVVFRFPPGERENFFLPLAEWDDPALLGDLSLEFPRFFVAGAAGSELPGPS